MVASAAGLGPGLHELCGITVEVDEAGVARRPGSPNLAGSTLTLPRMLKCLREGLGLDEQQSTQVLDTNPRKLGFAPDTGQ